jgi:hypothetical protein
MGTWAIQPPAARVIAAPCLRSCRTAYTHIPLRVLTITPLRPPLSGLPSAGAWLRSPQKDVSQGVAGPGWCTPHVPSHGIAVTQGCTNGHPPMLVAARACSIIRRSTGRAAQAGYPVDALTQPASLTSGAAGDCARSLLVSHEDGDTELLPQRVQRHRPV